MSLNEHGVAAANSLAAGLVPPLLCLRDVPSRGVVTVSRVPPRFTSTTRDDVLDPEPARARLLVQVDRRELRAEHFTGVVPAP